MLCSLLFRMTFWIVLSTTDLWELRISVKQSMHGLPEFLEHLDLAKRTKLGVVRAAKAAVEWIFGKFF